MDEKRERGGKSEREVRREHCEIGSTRRSRGSRDMAELRARQIEDIPRGRRRDELSLCLGMHTDIISYLAGHFEQ